MTKKRDRILEVALELFAENGFDGTTTAKIAKDSGVSEGLIFKHFENKVGLLNAIRDIMQLRLNSIIESIDLSEDPKTILKTFIELPFSIPETDYSYWRLQFKLKLSPAYSKSIDSNPLLEVLESVFARLGYVEPKFEAISLYDIINGVALQLLRNEISNREEYKLFLNRKYNLTD